MMAEVDFARLLQNFNTKAFSLYLITTGILSPSERDSLQDLKGDREILECLNGIWQSSVTDIHRRKLHATVREFAEHTYNIVDSTLKGSTLLQKDTQDFNSSSSSSSDDYTAGQYSQEYPDQDEFSGSQDTGYYTQTNSLVSFPSMVEGLHVTPSHQQRTVNVPKPSRAHSRNVKQKFVNLAGSTHYHYYNVPPQPTTSGLCQGHPSYPQLESGPSPGAISPAIGNFTHALRVCNKEFTVCMDISSLLPHLQAEQLVTPNECEIITSVYRTKEEKNQYLLSILSSKGEDAMDRFIKCLLNASEHSGHNHLVTLLKKVATSQ